MHYLFSVGEEEKKKDSWAFLYSFYHFIEKQRLTTLFKHWSDSFVLFEYVNY